MYISRSVSVGLLLLGFALPLSAQETTAPPTVAPPAVDASTPPKAEVPQQSLEDRITFLLSGYEYFPTRADLDAVAPADAVAAQLRAFATDLDARPSLRLRAVDALGYYDDDESVALMTQLVAEQPKEDLGRRKLRTAGLLRHHAITALATSQGEKSIPILQTVVAEDDLQLTLTVVHALAKHTGANGRKALRKLSAETENKTIRREVRKWVP